VRLLRVHNSKYKHLKAAGSTPALGYSYRFIRIFFAIYLVLRFFLILVMMASLTQAGYDMRGDLRAFLSVAKKKKTWGIEFF
jgi:hypothetical protein